MVLVFRKCARRPAFNHVAGHRERSAHKPDHRHPARQRPHHLLDRLAHIAQIIGVRDRQAIDVIAEVRTGLSITGPSPAAKRSFSPIGSTGSSKSAKMIAASTSRISTGCSVTCAAKSGRLQISRIPCLSADVPVLLHIAARLPHKPHRANIGRPAAASIEKPAIHGSHTHTPKLAQTFLGNACFLPVRGGFSLESAGLWRSRAAGRAGSNCRSGV